MTKQSPIFFITLLVINVVAGLLLSFYPLFNMILNSIVLCVALGFTWWTNKKEILPAFKLSLAFILPTITILELLIGCFSPSQIKDNWGIIAILCCIAFELLLISSIIRKSLIKTN